MQCGRDGRGRGEVDDDEAAVCVGGISMQVVLGAITVLVVTTATSAGKISGPLTSQPHNTTNTIWVSGPGLLVWVKTYLRNLGL